MLRLSLISLLQEQGLRRHDLPHVFLIYGTILFILCAVAAAGDGAGILAAMPDTFFHLVLQEEQRVKLPPLGQYAVGMTFLPQDGKQREEAKKLIEATAASLGHETIAWRSVPVNNKPLGKSARAVEPVIEQWFVSSKGKFFHLNTEQQVRPSGAFRASHQNPTKLGCSCQTTTELSLVDAG
jgi:glutamate synthase domain-containing protein 1